MEVPGGISGVIDQHDNQLTFHVQMLVVIPAEFRRRNPVTGKYDFDICQINIGSNAGVTYYKLRRCEKALRSTAAFYEQYRRRGNRGRGERHCLQVRVAVTWIETHAPEFTYQVIQGLLLTFRKRRPAAKLVGSQY